MTGCCYSNAADQRAVVMGRRQPEGCLMPIPNVATRGGKRCLSFPVFVVIGLVVVGWNVSRMLGGVASEDEWEPDLYCDKFGDCGGKYCAPEHDRGCNGGEPYMGFDTPSSCQAYWAAADGAPADSVRCRWTECLSYLHDGFCQLDTLASAQANMTDVVYACVRDEADRSSLTC